jgi:hypothetical protein
MVNTLNKSGLYEGKEELGRGTQKDLTKFAVYIFYIIFFIYKKSHHNILYYYIIFFIYKKSHPILYIYIFYFLFYFIYI